MIGATVAACSRLVGPGGIGKTRLARRALAELAPRFADGASSSRSRTSSTPAQLAGRIARELGISAEQRDRSRSMRCSSTCAGATRCSCSTTSSSSARRRRRSSKLLDLCPGLSVVVTSRVRLALAAEWICCRSKGCPSPKRGPRPRSSRSTRCACSCRQRSGSSPGSLPSVEATAIADICRQVEGLPLALELAASWTRVLSCDAIAAELRQGSELLQRGRPDPAGASRQHRHRLRAIVVDARRERARGAGAAGDLPRRLQRRVGARGRRRVAAGARRARRQVAAAQGRRAPVAPSAGAASRRPACRRRRGAPRARTGARACTSIACWRSCAVRSHDGDRAALQQIEREFENCRVAWRWAIRANRRDAPRGEPEDAAQFLRPPRRTRQEGHALAERSDRTDRVRQHGEHRRRPAGACSSPRAPTSNTAWTATPTPKRAQRARWRSTRRGDERDHESRLQALMVLGRMQLAPGQAGRREAPLRAGAPPGAAQP